MEQTLKMLEFDRILERLAAGAACEAAREELLATRPLADLARIEALRDRTGEAAAMLAAGNPPLPSHDGLADALGALQTQALLSPAQLIACGKFLDGCDRMRTYLSRMEAVAPTLAAWGATIDPLRPVYEELDRCFAGEELHDRASPQLYSLRRKLEQARQRIQGRLEALLRGHPEYFMETFMTQRQGRWVLAVRREQRAKVPGTVVDRSASGGTLFVEPAAAGKLRDEMEQLTIDERNEVQRILYTLTDLVAQHLPQLLVNRDCLVELDGYFARGKLALGMGARPARVHEGRELYIRQGRHPLLPPESCVPLDFFLGREPAQTGVVITGPNTGGKTVALKTVGLLALMAQSGLHVPAEEARFPLLDTIQCDLGDGQSIAQNLSTFSAHVTRWIEILAKATPRALVLADELGAGTDPVEGMSLAQAMLETLAQRGCLILATTHYPEIKAFAARTPGFLNARMAFDRGTLLPLYRLELGRAGESCALLIAQRLGLPQAVLERAYAAGNLEPLPEAPAAERAVALPEPEPEPEAPAEQQREPEIRIGDSVFVNPLGRAGIVARFPGRGNVEVMVAGKRYTVPLKRVRPHLSREELYPGEDYDLSIVLDTVENRKNRHKIARKHAPGAEVVLRPDRE